MRVATGRRCNDSSPRLNERSRSFNGRSRNFSVRSLRLDVHNPNINARSLRFNGRSRSLDSIPFGRWEEVREESRAGSSNVRCHNHNNGAFKCPGSKIVGLKIESYNSHSMIPGEVAISPVVETNGTFLRRQACWDHRSKAERGLTTTVMTAAPRFTFEMPIERR
jgi:hypothetical protein